MNTQQSRRRFLATTALGGAALGLGELGFLRELPRVSAAESQLDPKLVRVESGIEPLVILLEQTPRGRLLEAVAEKIHDGTSYREVLAALMLAGVRNVQPRPSVGFKFHSVLVVNSAHLASLNSPDTDRWLPIFWALDYFKATQLEEERASGWKLGPVKESDVPAPSKAKAAFVEAMNKWDVEAADAAVAGFVRSAGSQEVVETFYRLGARDFRSIGHKAIYVANSWRTLQCIGWQHAEPIVRSLTYALLNHEGESNPAQSDHAADRPWRQNEGLAKSIREDWQDGQPKSEATRDLLATLRNGSPEDGPRQAVELLNAGVAPQSLWDALLVGSGELLMRQPGIVGLHTLTSANALHYAYSASDDDNTRRMLLLQNCAFLPMFRQSAQGRGRMKDMSIDDLQPIEPSKTEPADAIAEIFADATNNREQAAAKIRAFLAGGGNAKQLIDAAQRLVFIKGNDAHDYKFSSAVLEDYGHVSPDWRDLFLSLAVFNLPASGERDNQLVERTRGALAS